MANVQERPACEVWMNASLHAHLGRPSVPGFCCPSRDLSHGQQIGRAPQVLCNLALAEGAELTGIYASIGVVYVAIHSVRDPAGGHHGFSKSGPMDVHVMYIMHAKEERWVLWGKGLSHAFTTEIRGKHVNYM